jgi:hypothetical protein
MISMGNSLPSFRRPRARSPCRSAAPAPPPRCGSVGDQPFREALGNDVLHLLPDQFIAAVSELFLRLNIQQDDLPALVHHHHRIRSRLQQPAVPALHLRQMLFRALRTLMSRIAAVTRIPSALSSGLSMISMGNSLPSFRRPDELDPRADLLRQRLAALRVPSAISRSAKPSGMMFFTFCPTSSSRRYPNCFSA